VESVEVDIDSQKLFKITNKKIRHRGLNRGPSKTRN